MSLPQLKQVPEKMDNQPHVAVVKMYKAREDIFPREITGKFASLRWICVWLTQLVFYGLPWLSWNGRQLVLFDLTARKFYIFGIVLWPQDFIYLAALLIICAYSLFLITAMAGRVWCGYACPQTVYTEMFMWVERRIEGTRSARMRLARQPWGAEKVARKGGKHVVWIAMALWTGLTFVGYFTPIHTLIHEVTGLTLGPWEWFWVLFYAFATYGNAGWMREQVCKYMCPYARFQSAMFDKDTLIVTYDEARGEPRGARAKNEVIANRQAGDCIDCSMCVQVCPTGIDIRKGLQYECIGCAACVDACDSVMDKVGLPRGLVRYSTEHAVKQGWNVSQIRRHVLRPRVLLYIGLLGLIVLAFFTSLTLRTPLKLDVIRDRGSMGREVDDGQIENVYRLQIMNTAEKERRLRIVVGGMDGIRLDTPDQITIPGTTSQAIAARVRVPGGSAHPGSNKITFDLQSQDGDKLDVHEKAVFIIPR